MSFNEICVINCDNYHRSIIQLNCDVSKLFCPLCGKEVSEDEIEDEIIA